MVETTHRPRWWMILHRICNCWIRCKKTTVKSTPTVLLQRELNCERFLFWRIQKFKMHFCCTEKWSSLSCSLHSEVVLIFHVATKYAFSVILRMAAFDIINDHLMNKIKEEKRHIYKNCTLLCAVDVSS